MGLSLSNLTYKGRKKTQAVKVGDLVIGAGAPIVVQSMTNTDTADVRSTIDQVIALANAGSEMVRVTVNTKEAAAAIAPIVEGLLKRNCTVPLVGDFHYIGHTLLTQYPDCARLLAKYRINPGNIGNIAKRDAHFTTLIETAIRYDKPVRIGVNWGSVDRDLLMQKMDENARSKHPKDSRAVMHDALITSALQSAQQAQAIGLEADKIILSCKVSQVQDLIALYQQLAERCDYALHLGLTEAGMGSKGIVASTVAIGVLLQQGIGDTIRISLTPNPGGDRCQEVQVAQEILQTMGLRHFTPLVVACPGCGRTTSSVFQELALDIQSWLSTQMPLWRDQFPGVEKMSVAVMGCVVNGPGESKQADIGISLPGTGEAPIAPVFVDGKKAKTLRGAHIADEFKQIVMDYVTKRFTKNTQESIDSIHTRH